LIIRHGVSQFNKFSEEFSNKYKDKGEFEGKLEEFNKYRAEQFSDISNMDLLLDAKLAVNEGHEQA
jgi:hypothetical protein